MMGRRDDGVDVAAWVLAWLVAWVFASVAAVDVAARGGGWVAEVADDILGRGACLGGCLGWC